MRTCPFCETARAWSELDWKPLCVLVGTRGWCWIEPTRRLRRFRPSSPGRFRAAIEKAGHTRLSRKRLATGAVDCRTLAIYRAGGWLARNRCLTNNRLVSRLAAGQATRIVASRQDPTPWGRHIASIWTPCNDDDTRDRLVALGSHRCSPRGRGLRFAEASVADVLDPDRERSDRENRNQYEDPEATFSGQGTGWRRTWVVVA